MYKRHYIALDGAEFPALQHHGVMGQKWGVRRYQNKDGSLTAAGKARKHEFTKDPGDETNYRKEALHKLGGTAALTGLGVATNAALLGMGAISPHAVAATVGMAGLTAAGAGKIVKTDIDTAVGNSKEKKFIKERMQNPIDKKTGFHLKTTEMTPDEDMERVNPLYKNWDSDTKNNCVLCSAAMELRRRGYDVEANKSSIGQIDTDNLFSDWFQGSKSKLSDGSVTDEWALNMINNVHMAPYTTPTAQQKMIKSTITEIKSQPDKARGELSVMWNGTISGHSLFYQNENGNIVVYDTQANKKYSGDRQVKSLLSRCSSTAVTRLDNCKLNVKYIKEVAHSDC